MHQFVVEKKLYAQLAVRVGLNLQKGQPLIVVAPIEAIDLVRYVTDEAYKVGASDVTVFYQDNEMVLSRLRYADDVTMINQWIPAGIESEFGKGAARLVILGDSLEIPEELSERRKEFNKANMESMKGLYSLIKQTASNWSLLAYATPKWASSVFPDMNVDDAIDTLWKKIFSAVRLDTSDIVEAWSEHNKVLAERASFMNNYNFEALHFSSPNTELTVGLADGHIWKGGAKTTLTGIECNSNLPTEEIFTTPHNLHVDGFVTATKPMMYQGKLIEGIRVCFKQGVAVEAYADTNQDILHELINTDENSCRLGEIALVPHSSPISKSNILYKNTLFDENASCHLAFGGSYDHCMKEGDDIVKRGANKSIVHQDWMIGSENMDVFGIKDGKKILIMHNGEWFY